MSQAENGPDRDVVDTPSGTESIGFAAAMSELSAIVSELESDQLDVDVLAERVERAALLVGTCRDRLDATRLKVEEIIVRLDNVEATGATSAGSATDDVED
ncbi:MAG: exodeoxyribonuclease VII small subunit [Microthrixaceae bacterium]